MNRILFALMWIASVLPVAVMAADGDGEGSVRPDTRPLPETPLALKTLAVRDLRDVTTNLLTLSGRRLTVMVFLYPECPLSRQAIPVLNQIAEDLSRSGGAVLGLFHETVTRPEIEGFALDFKTRFPLLRDPGGQVARALQATTTPESFVVDATGRVRYAGRVDDQYRVRGIRRPAPEREDLQEAVRDVLAGVEVRVPRTRPVGCPLNRRDVPIDPAPLTKTGITYHRDIIRILNKHCLKCHSEGGVGPFTLTSYDDASDWMKTAIREIRARRMPPAQVESDVPLLEQNHLTDSEVLTLQAWLKSGMPEGDPADSAGLQMNGPPREWDPRMERPPDIILEQPTETHLGPKGKDVYWFINFELNRNEDLNMQAIQVLPRNSRIVHHALVGAVPKDEVGTMITRLSWQTPANEPGDQLPGYSAPHRLGFTPTINREGGVLAFKALPTYIPGVGAVSVSEGDEWTIPAGSDILLQMHYNRSGKQETDRCRVGIWLNRKPPSPERKVFWALMSTPFVVIPKGAKNVMLRGSFTLPEDYEAAGIYPHCHQIATQVGVVAYPPDGPATVLVRVPQWDFNWQSGAIFADPVWLPKGTRIEFTAIFDNTEDNPRNPHSPPVDVFLGEASDDEMIFPGIVLIGKNHPDPEGTRILRFVTEMVRGKEFRQLVQHKANYVADPDGTVRPKTQAQGN